MSVVLNFAVFLLILSACNSNKVTPVAIKEDVPFFSVLEVITASNALTAIIDWPQETVSLQKNLEVAPEAAQKMILPLHPLWDEKLDEVGRELATWDQSKITSFISQCESKCECSFYQEALERSPHLLERNPGLKRLTETKIQRLKSEILSCLQNMGPIQKILQYLRAEQKNFEAESIY